ncbi:AraC family transcriptional regulator [Rhodobacteraceae bacterium CCMM004]|nr:AraC family transcriptional regulator [Rhodobacteraceae bacterium CCMM004]
MAVDRAHPLVVAPPHAVCWRRSDRRASGALPAAHAELVVLHGLQGRARYLLDGAVHRLGPGTLLWALSGQVHVLLDDTPEFDMWVVLASDRLWPPGPGPARPPLSLGAAPPPAPRALSPGAGEELAAIAAAAQAADDPEARGAGLRWWLLRAWALWQAAEHRPAQSLHPAVARAAHLLRADPARDLASVAAEAGLSQSRLSHLFAAELGTGLVAYRTDRRLDAVDRAMRGGERALLRAVLSAGFGSYAQFWRAFRARHREGPGRHYRRWTGRGP